MLAQVTQECHSEDRVLEHTPGGAELSALDRSQAETSHLICDLPGMLVIATHSDHWLSCHHGNQTSVLGVASGGVSLHEIRTLCRLCTDSCHIRKAS